MTGKNNNIIKKMAWGMIAITASAMIGVGCGPAADKEDVAEEGTEKIVLEDFDQNGIAEYAVISIDTDNTDYEGRLQFYWNEKCVYEYNSPLRILFVSEAGYVDLDEDGEKEIYLVFSSNVNSMPLEEYIVLKQKGEAWEPLEMYHGEDMRDNGFPITIKGGSGTTAVIACEGTEQTISYELENYWSGVLKQVEQSEDVDYSYIEHMVAQDRSNFREGKSYGSVMAWGIWEVNRSTFEGKDCLIASHGIGGIDFKFYEVGILDVYFNYDLDGKIRILNLKFNPQYPAEEVNYTEEAVYTEELVYAQGEAVGRETAVRYQGTYYSVLIPETGWEYEKGLIAEKEMDLWKLASNEDIQFCVISLGDMEKDDATEWVIKQYDEYHLEMNEFGELQGTAENGEKVLDVKVFHLEGTCAVARFYPLETVDEAGSKMRAMKNSFVFEDIPGLSDEFSYANLSEQEFWFCSGAGGWRTILYINADGSFYGDYIDSDMGLNRAYLCDFTGQLSEPIKVNDYTWSAKIESMELAQEVGKQETRDGINYIYSAPYGLEKAEEILFFMPGAQTSELPEEFMSWVNGPRWGENKVLYKLNCYGIYNVNEELGFSSIPKHYFEE